MWYSDIQQFLIDNTVLLGSLAAVVAIFSFLFAPIRRLFAKSGTDVPAIVQTLRETANQEGALSTQLGDAQQRIENLEDENRQLTEAVQALSDERDKPNAPAGIDEALALLVKGETAAAEAVFQSVKEGRKAEGAEASKEAAAAARHIGALAFLHDTYKALAAYREADELDPDNADGWNQLGHLLKRRGDLDNAAEAYERVLSLGNSVDDQVIISIATGNLGIIYSIRGDLDAAEDMYRKSLTLDEALNCTEGMANHCGNLGNLYSIRGDLDAAEGMYSKSLALNETLGRKEGMATLYGNLGVLFDIRGEFDVAEEMYRKSLVLNEALGSKAGMASA